MFSLRSAHPDQLASQLLAALARPPYTIEVTKLPDIAEDAIDATAKSLGETQGLLLYQLRADGGDAELRLVFYPSSSAAPTELAKTVPGDGFVTSSPVKLVPVALVLLLIGGVVLSRKLRGKGTITVAIERPTDSSDEVFCIAISKSKVRPTLGDVAKFHATTRQAGPVTKPLHATLVSPGTTSFTVAPGAWHVHLYGCHRRGDGELWSVPHTCSQVVEVERHEVAVADFDLTPELAELQISIEGAERKGVAIWVDKAAIVHSDDAGRAVLALPVGENLVYLESKGLMVTRPMQIDKPAIYRLAVDIARERRTEFQGREGIADAPPPGEPPAQNR